MKMMTSGLATQNASVHIWLKIEQDKDRVNGRAGVKDKRRFWV